MTLVLGFRCVGVVVVAVVATPYFAAVLPLIVFIFGRITERYRRSCREVQRLLSVSRSPLFTLLEEALAGLSSIRAYRVQREIVAQFERRMDLSTRSVSPCVLPRLARRAPAHARTHTHAHACTHATTSLTP